MSFDPELADVDNDNYLTGVVSVGSTQVEAKVGVGRLSRREGITLTNKGPNRVFYGPTGVTVSTGDYLDKNQFVSLPLGESIGVFLICDTGKTASVVVQEIA